MTEVERTPSRIGPRQVPLENLLPHPLNSNVMPPEYRERLLAHIRRTSRYPYLVVRPHPTEAEKYQVMAGSLNGPRPHDQSERTVWRLTHTGRARIGTLAMFG
jgi:hypothetical protein